MSINIETNGTEFIFDRLNIMFNDQAKKQKIIANIDLPNDNSDLVSYFALGLISEIGELLNADKRWKTVNQLNIGDCSGNLLEGQKELVDCWAFLINLTLAMNLDASKLFELFNQKSEIVWERIKNKKE